VFVPHLLEQVFGAEEGWPGSQERFEHRELFRGQVEG
jgi:hypothetical protein